MEGDTEQTNHGSPTEGPAHADEGAYTSEDVEGHEAGEQSLGSPGGESETVTEHTLSREEQGD